MRSCIPAVRADRSAGSATGDTRRHNGSGEHLSGDSRKRYLPAAVAQYLSSAQFSAVATVFPSTPICLATASLPSPNRIKCSAYSAICWYFGGSAVSRRATRNATSAMVRILCERVHQFPHSAVNIRTPSRVQSGSGNGTVFASVPIRADIIIPLDMVSYCHYNP